MQCNGRPLPAEACALLAPAADPAPQLFAGSGPPPPEAGAILEWCGEVAAEEAVEICLARADR